MRTSNGTPKSTRSADTNRAGGKCGEAKGTSYQGRFRALLASHSWSWRPRGGDSRE
jgi:hypothetical protein